MNTDGSHFCQASVVQRLSDTENLDDIAWLLDGPVKTLIFSAVDKTIRENVELHARAGLSPRIMRTAESGCCEWCAALAGTWEYQVPQDVYRRHERCRCVVEYAPRNVSRRQNAWTKRWTDPDEGVKIEARKQYGTDALLKGIAEHPERLVRYTPGSLKTEMEQQGIKVTPLAQYKEFLLRMAVAIRRIFPTAGC